VDAAVVLMRNYNQPACAKNGLLKRQAGDSITFRIHRQLTRARVWLSGSGGVSQ
jgi:hypothetical protein